MANNNEVRLQKFMAEQGVASRRKSEDLIRAGKVKVNGQVEERRGRKLHKGDVFTYQGQDYKIV